MIQRCCLVKCDICGREEIITEDIPYTDRWADFVLGDIHKMEMERRDPSNVCLNCADRIRRFIYAIKTETGGESK